MKINHFTESGGGLFVADDEGREAGRMTYSDAAPDRMIIDHTEVSPRYQGRGIGRQMVMACVDYARKHDMKVVPVCPFAREIFVRDSGIHDVLYK